MYNIIFLGFIGSAEEIDVHEEKVRAIKYCSTPSTISQISTIHGLSSLHWNSIPHYIMMQLHLMTCSLERL